MKKVISLVLIFILALSIFTGCAKNASNDSDKNIRIGASPTPHADILKIVKDILKEKGYELDILEFTDYVQPNLTLDTGDLDANYFQHKPYMDDFNEKNNTKLVSVAAVHYEPLGLYPGKTKTMDELKDGAQIAVPSDTTNEARALLLLETQGLITLKEDAGLLATKNDIVENPKNLKIVELEAAQLARSLQDVDMAVINGNYAIQAGLNAATDALAKEEQDSLAASTFANILAVKEGNENSEKTKALIEALKSDKVKEFIEEKYQGAVVPVN